MDKEQKSLRTWDGTKKTWALRRKVADTLLFVVLAKARL